ncbi:thioredoxin family protein [Candidatus Sulfurimonas marisnigri]|uniref:Thioredoxin family protein n=1 Tax=Candidatus Sulfurimonas marisnigri TaxID=2740405 RepID=A0A7S7M0J0_9BACT|nr:thioredoxin family protein [Candidatus Sulfurimonas marisnigri]QOY53989.1 thioredoxin family protein [Candidatus Sulfurimonas marisnigri]
MRYLILVIALLSTLNAFDWPSDYEEALEQAKKEKKNIYLLIGSEYCHFCTKLKSNVLVKDEVVKRLKKDYVLLYLSTVMDEIPGQFETKSIPRHYFLKENGKIIYTTVGYRNIQGFYELLEEVEMFKDD